MARGGAHVALAHVELAGRCRAGQSGCLYQAAVSLSGCLYRVSDGVRQTIEKLLELNETRELSTMLQNFEVGILK